MNSLGPSGEVLARQCQVQGGWGVRLAVTVQESGRGRGRRPTIISRRRMHHHGRRLALSSRREDVTADHSSQLHQQLGPFGTASTRRLAACILAATAVPNLGAPSHQSPFTIDDSWQGCACCNLTMAHSPACSPYSIPGTLPLRSRCFGGFQALASKLLNTMPSILRSSS